MIQLRNFHTFQYLAKRYSTLLLFYKAENDCRVSRVDAPTHVNVFVTRSYLPWVMPA